MQIVFRDSGNVRGRLRELASKDPRRALPVIGETMVEHVRESFAQSRDPYGNPWQPLSETTLRLRRRGSGAGGVRILQDTRRLYNSINSQVRGRGEVATGSNAVYAATQQFGRDDNTMFGRGNAPIPARPYLPIRDGQVVLPAAWQADIVDTLEDLYDL